MIIECKKAVLKNGFFIFNTNFSIEASRRIDSSWKTEIETRIFSSIDTKELILPNFQNIFKN